MRGSLRPSKNMEVKNRESDESREQIEGAEKLLKEGSEKEKKENEKCTKTKPTQTLSLPRSLTPSIKSSNLSSFEASRKTHVIPRGSRCIPGKRPSDASIESTEQNQLPKLGTSDPISSGQLFRILGRDGPKSMTDPLRVPRTLEAHTAHEDVKENLHNIKPH
ncbi:hypothetical protein PIB30_026777 [Stylosanthes scabra]|uniref:Uncharacterized protein n=1 Tax=Stylosanthes scabra TaxID=79078 RepID=A0ABU6YCD3_9FABA|nr:hypothetical protein [Stylosanthes scabra]